MSIFIGAALEVAQEAAGVGGGPRRVDAHENPAGGAVDGHEEVAAPLLVGHLRQILDVDVQVAGLMGLEGLVGGLRGLGLEVAQVAHPVAAQAAVEPRARDVGVQELAHHREQVVQRQQQRPAQNHRNCLLRRREGRLQPVRRVAAVLHAVALAPLPHRLLADPVALGHQPGRLVARLDRRPDLRRRRRLLVKRDQHVSPPSRYPRRIDLAMNRAVRRRVYVIIRDGTV